MSEDQDWFNVAAQVEYLELRIQGKDGTLWAAKFLPLTGDCPEMILLERDLDGSIVRQTGWRLASPMEQLE